VQSPKTILCVDDEKLQLQLRKALLESAGFIVLAAQSSEDAMEMFRTHHVDAVVTDYWLSGNNGTALAEQMKRLRPRIPILMLSGFSSLPGEGAVVDAWLRKAEVEPEELIETVNRLIGLRSDSQQGANS
jgi:CheY-like chemotaxis protein